MTDQLGNLSKSRRRPVVLIVDDEEMVTQSLGALLELETDYQVVTFQSPVDALATLQKRPVDLVISDFLMPNLDGLQFLSQVKKMYPEVPRVLLTGYADKENAIKAINEVELFQYIEKPWDNDHVKLIVDNGIATRGLKNQLQEKVRDLDRALLQRDVLSERNDELSQELLLARRVQERMLPQSFPENNGISFAVKYQPALEVGGDYYDILPMANDRIAVLLSDVTGHGISAALSTVLLKVAFGSFKDSEAGPAEIMAGMNQVLHGILPEEMFAASLVVMLDPQTSVCRLASGGGPHPFELRRGRGSVERIAISGLLLGMFGDEIYQSSEETDVELKEGDCLILYTDGLSEVENQSGEAFDEGSLVQTISDSQDKPASEILEQLTTAARDFSSPDHQWDDVTLMGLDVTLG